MAGGKGTRMNSDSEKLLLEYKKPIILHVIDSLKNSNYFSKILAITSSNSPKTKQLLEKNNVETFDTSGRGYVEDLNMALRSFNEDVFVISGDLPLIDEKIIRDIVSKYDPQNVWTSILVTNKFLNSLGLDSEYSVHYGNQQCHFTGISLINSKKIVSSKSIDENYVILDDKRIAFNLNTQKDFDLLSTT